MAITTTVTKVACGESHSGIVEFIGYATNAGTYTTSGDTGLAAALATYMTTIYAVMFAPSANGYTASYTHATDKLVLFDFDSEVANAEANTEVFRFVAKGSKGAV
jgi:hypothetical protein